MDDKINSLACQELSAMDYFYRDASNYKIFGSIFLSGKFDNATHSQLTECLDDGEYFIAEQIGVPPLYPVLFQIGGGPTDDDHAWHTIEGLRGEVELPAGTEVWGSLTTLITAFRAAKGNWKPELSPNFDRQSLTAIYKDQAGH